MPSPVRLPGEEAEEAAVKDEAYEHALGWSTSTSGIINTTVSGATIAPMSLHATPNMFVTMNGSAANLTNAMMVSTTSMTTDSSLTTTNISLGSLAVPATTTYVLVPTDANFTGTTTLANISSATIGISTTSPESVFQIPSMAILAVSDILNPS